MMDWTDRHCRAFHRLLTRRARLYTEMLTADAVCSGGASACSASTSSRASGCAAARRRPNPARLAEAARIGEDFGYDEINLNFGCPSERVQSGRFGACLMREPALVAECVAAMVAAVDVPATVKCRIGVDEQEPREALVRLRQGCEAGRRGGAHRARAQGLARGPVAEGEPGDPAARLPSRLCASSAIGPIGRSSSTAAFPTLKAARAHLEHVDGVMLGRAAYQNPELLIGIDPALFGEEAPVADAFEAIEAFMPTIARGLARGERLQDYTRHLHGLFARRPGARAYRRALASECVRADAGLDALREALTCVEQGPERAAGRPEGRPSLDGLWAAK